MKHVPRKIYLDLKVRLSVYVCCFTTLRATILDDCESNKAIFAKGDLSSQARHIFVWQQKQLGREASKWKKKDLLKEMC